MSNEGPGGRGDEYLKYRGSWAKQTASLEVRGLGSGPVPPLIMATILEATPPRLSPGVSPPCLEVLLGPRPFSVTPVLLPAEVDIFLLTLQHPAHSSVTATATFNYGPSQSVPQRREKQGIGWFGAPFPNVTPHYA